MELKEFANLIANNRSYNIKVVMSALLEQSSSDANWGKAIANLYKDFPNELKNLQVIKRSYCQLLLGIFQFME